MVKRFESLFLRQFDADQILISEGLNNEVQALRREAGESWCYQVSKNQEERKKWSYVKEMKFLCGYIIFQEKKNLKYFKYDVQGHRMYSNKDTTLLLFQCDNFNHTESKQPPQA